VIAALYVQKGGCYYGLTDVDPWDQDRDARLYAGPHPVVAHPPCERWGSYWAGSPAVIAKTGQRKILGDDGGCFVAALASVRRWGGVLEHPEGSHAWAAHDLMEPPRSGGWVVADWHGGWTCCVEQGAYGHQARKPTWLYAVGVDLPALAWGKSTPVEMPGRSERWKARAAKDGVCVLLSRAQRAATPIPFRDLLISIAASAQLADRMAA